MGLIKTRRQIELMKISGKICTKALKEVLDHLQPNVKCIDLDRIAQKSIERQGAAASFTTVDTYQWTTCITINEQVVHGIPSDRQIKNGDIVSIDIGAIYKGFHSDMAITVPVAKIAPNLQKFLQIGQKTLHSAIAQARVGNTIGDISATIQEMIEGASYSVVKSLTGHGIGRQLHEEPPVPGFGKAGTGLKIRQNMTLAIEVIYAQGSGEVFLENDGWTITTKDGSYAGLFEQTIAVTGNGPIVLTPYI